MSFHKVFEDPRVYQYTQLLNPFTVGVVRDFIRKYLKPELDRSVLDIGCGTGVYSTMFTGGGYLGVDINPDYIASATRAFGPKFQVMDAGAMAIGSARYDAAFTVSTCHHIDDDAVARMITSVLPVLKPGGAFHIIDALLPVSSFAPVRNLVFRNDRGRNQRTLEQMSSLVASAARIRKVDLRSSVFHDMCYFELTS